MRYLFSEDAGGIDEEGFQVAFNDYTELSISSGNEVESELTKFIKRLAIHDEDWEKRVEQVTFVYGIY